MLLVRTKCKIFLRKYLDFFLAQFGYKLIKLMPPLRTTEDLARSALSGLSTAFVIDVGAADGNFTHGVLEIIPTAEVICIDPIKRHCQALSKRFVTNKVHVEQIALGEDNSDIIFYETAHPHSSSLLPPGKHTEHFPTASGHSTQYPVRVRRLDNLVEDNQTIDLLKIDTQGYELSVLKGAGEKLDKCKYLIVEMSLRPLYEGQPSFEKIIDFLHQRGFHMIDYVEGAKSYVTGEILQLDVLYQRTN